MEVKKMKVEIKKILFFGIIGILVFSSIGTIGVLGVNQNHKILSVSLDKDIDRVDDTQHHGSSRFCFFHVDTTEMEGLPNEERYSGVLTGVDATIYGASMFGVVPFPLIIFSTFFDTDEPIYVTIDFFWGLVDPTSENSIMIGGFARNLKWEW